MNNLICNNFKNINNQFQQAYLCSTKLLFKLENTRKICIRNISRTTSFSLFKLLYYCDIWNNVINCTSVYKKKNNRNLAIYNFTQKIWLFSLSIRHVRLSLVNTIIQSESSKLDSIGLNTFKVMHFRLSTFVWKTLGFVFVS
jgi:hypothetical protein